MCYGLSELTIDKLLAIFKDYIEIQSVVLYGSRAKGNYREGSDIDLTIKSDSLTYSQLLKIECRIDDLDLPHKVDLSIFKMIDNEKLIQHINKYGIILFAGTNKQQEDTGLC